MVTGKTNKRLNIILIVSLSIALIVLTLKRTSVLSSDSDKQYTIAVLPFENLSTDRDRETEYFCDGMTVDMMASLVKIEGISILSYLSVKEYKDSDKSVPDIANELSVNYIIKGSIRKNYNNVIIESQLLDASDELIWSVSYTGKIDNDFMTKRQKKQTSQDVINQLIRVLRPEERIFFKYSSTKNKEAYELYLKGCSLANSKEKEDLKLSIELFNQALVLDPKYVEASIQKSLSYLELEFYHGLLN